MTDFLDPVPQATRRDRFFEETRNRIGEAFDEDGRGLRHQFASPHREPCWILPALYTGDESFVRLANRVVERFGGLEGERGENEHVPAGGLEWNIFISNVMSHCLHRFDDRLTPGAREVMEIHGHKTVQLLRGSGQPDYKFHGANDNMPMMSTYGMIFAGEALDLPHAIDHGLWKLEEVRRLLSRAAWMSEFNSSTYSAITLGGAAKLASYARTPEVRELALEIEQRLWAEVLLHYHPGTFMQAGPHCRAYPIDCAGHTHTLQVLLWMAFGEAVGRDPIRSYFELDGKEVLHFTGDPWKSVAEFCDVIDTELHVPASLEPLVTDRSYPSHHRGRSEAMSRYDGGAAVFHTETWMEEAFSLGTVNGPLMGGEQTSTCYLTYRRKPEVSDFRDAATLYFKVLAGVDERPAGSGLSADERYVGDLMTSNDGWWYSLQKENTALLLTAPNLGNLPKSVSFMRLSLVFPAQYGRILKTVIGDGPVEEGATGESEEVVPVSIETGEVYIHVQPLLPTELPRSAALRFGAIRSADGLPAEAVNGAVCTGAAAEPGPEYETLDLINYEGPEREMSREEAAQVLNGMLLTVEAKKDNGTLAAFHARCSEVRVRDYFALNHRYLLVQREDVEYEVAMTTNPFSVQTESIDGRTAPRPVMESNQLDVKSLPFLDGPVPRSRPFFPWDTMFIPWYPEFPWLIGSRGIPGETNYSNRTSGTSERRTS